MPLDNDPPREDVTVLGETNFRNQRRQFGIKTDDRRRHLYVIGKTGVGKSTLLANMITQDIQRGLGVAVVDPHGDLADAMLDFIPAARVNDIVYFDPSNGEYPIAFNVLETVDPSHPRFQQEKNLVASGLVGVFKKIWADSWGPRLEYILRNTILALLDVPGNTLLGIPRIYVDKGFRKRIVDKIQDPVVKAFWVDEFANYNERFRAEAISPIQNKVGQFLSSSIIRNIVGQPKSTIDMSDIMNNGKILLMNLSKGKIGEDNSSLIGAMMITKIQLAAMDRARIPEAERRDFYLYVDEFQNFATESFATILSEARKYHLNLILAHQYITQMVEPVRDAVFGNLGTILCFRVGAYDAEFLEPEFAPGFTQTDIVNLDNHNAYIKLMIDGVTSKPFSMETLPPSGVRSDNREKVLRVSCERHGRPRVVVEEKIARWSGVMFRENGEQEIEELAERAPTFARGSGEARPARMGETRERRGEPRSEERPERERERPAPHRRQPDGTPAREPSVPEPEELEDVLLAVPEERMPIRNLAEVLAQKAEPQRLKRVYPTTCDRCGKETEIPFEPVLGKPKYCKECLAIVRAERRRQEARTGTSGGTSSPPPPPVRRVTTGDAR